MLFFLRSFFLCGWEGIIVSSFYICGFYVCLLDVIEEDRGSLFRYLGSRFMFFGLERISVGYWVFFMMSICCFVIFSG